MRPSPMRHTLAILRTTIGLTQKEMAQLVERAARTIQAIELGHLPLSEELALRIAKETGVDESWLLQGDTSVPPQRGKAMLAFSHQRRPYRREDYEWQRAFNEAPTASERELAEVVRKGAEKEGGDLRLTLAQVKAAARVAEPLMLESMDEKFMAAMAAFLKQTIKLSDALLVRWKLRRLMESLAKERAIQLPPRDLWSPTRKVRKSRGPAFW